MTRFAILMLAFVAFTPARASESMWVIAKQTADGFHDAQQKGDRDAALALLDDNVKIYEQGWVEQSKAEYAAQHLDSDIRFAQGTRSETISQSETMDYGLCYFTTEVHTTGTFEGKPVDSFALETMILRRDGNAWKIAHIHWSSRKPKP